MARAKQPPLTEEVTEEDRGADPTGRGRTVA